MFFLKFHALVKKIRKEIVQLEKKKIFLFNFFYF